MTRVEKNAEELRRKGVTMNDFKSKLDDLLDELERCCASQHFEVADDIRAKIHKLVGDKIPQWNKLTFRPITLEEKEFHPDWTEIVENLPNLDEEVLVTDGTNIWVDGFDIDDFVYLSGTDTDIDGVIAWIELPEPYKRGTVMISRDKLINYASNFLDSEIQEIGLILEVDDVSDADRELLSRLLKEYERDLEELEKETV